MRSLIRKLVVTVALIGVLALIAAFGVWAWTGVQSGKSRESLFAEVQPVKLTNCQFERLGDAHDGGYLVCANLLGPEQSAYSYGINGNDAWGCQVSGRLGIPVHQYDCFNTDRPVCSVGTLVFHEECVGPARQTDEGRVFDTVQAQIARNGDADKRLIMKMDVEGAEWPSLLSASDEDLKRISQLTVEFHDVNEARFVETIRRLKRVFHIANVHYNNWVCDPAAAPFPSLAFEVLFVNKDLGVVDPGGHAVAPNPLDAPNNAKLPDCQTAR